MAMSLKEIFDWIYHQFSILGEAFLNLFLHFVWIQFTDIENSCSDMFKKSIFVAVNAGRVDYV